MFCKLEKVISPISESIFSKERAHSIPWSFRNQCRYPLSRHIPHFLKLFAILLIIV